MYDFQIYIGTFFAVDTPLLVLKHYKQHTSLISHSSDIKKLINEIKLILNDIHLTLRVRASKFSDTSRSLHEPLFEDFFLHSPRGINLKVNWENIKESHDNFRKNQQQLLNNIKDELGNYLKEINISYFTDTIPTNHKGNCIIFQSLFEAFIVNLESKILYDKWVYDPNNIVINRTEKTISFPPSTRIGQGSLSYLNRTKDFLFQFNSTISHTIFAKEVLILNDHKVQFERRKSVFIKNLEYLLTIPILPNKCQFIPFSIPSIIRFIKSIFYKN